MSVLRYRRCGDLEAMQRRLKILTGVLALLVAASFGVLVWALEKSWAIGNEADLTGGNGGVDQIVWVRLLMSLGVLATASITLIIILCRARQRLPQGQ